MNDSKLWEFNTRQVVYGAVGKRYMASCGEHQHLPPACGGEHSFRPARWSC